jgi:hypothetical protein
MAPRRKLPITPIHDAPIAEQAAASYAAQNATSEPTLANEILWGAEQIAAFIGVGTRRVFYLLANGALPATKTGATWTSTKSRLRRHFGGEAAS